jgi:hypothetical protein
MSGFKKVLVVAALLLAGSGGQLSVAGQEDVDPAALAVAQTYFSALHATATPVSK